MAVVEPAHVERFLEICRKWDVQATVVGEVTRNERLIIDWHGQTIVDVDPKTVAHEGPVYERPYRRPDWLDRVNADDANKLPRDNTPEALRSALLRMVSSPNLCDKSWVTNQYDRYVRGNSILAQPENSGMLRIDPETDLGIALSIDCNGRMCYLNPYLGAQHALAEAYRNVATTGAEPLAITDCLNFGSPEDPSVMWQFVETIQGLVDGCKELGTPVTGGNVSFYNQTGETAILPTPTVGVLGVIDDVSTRIPMAFAHPDDEIWLLGETREQMSGSVWADIIHDGHLGGLPPKVDLDHEKRLAATLVAAARGRVLRSAHDLADGGLAQALVESCLRKGFGATVDLGQGDATVELFSESTGRVLVSVSGDKVAALRRLAGEQRIPVRRLGTVTDEGPNAELVFQDLVEVSLDELHGAWTATIPEAMRA